MTAWRPHGRATTSASRPRAIAICDRCGFMFNHSELDFQPIQAGMSVKQTNLLVCKRCRDDINPGLRPIVPPPDPMPKRNPRPEDFESEMGELPPAQSVKDLLDP